MELQSNLPLEYSFDESTLCSSDLEDEHLMMYHRQKKSLFEELGKCDFILLVAGLYDLKNNDFHFDFLMQNDPIVSFDDEYGEFIPKVQISRKGFSVLGFQWQGLLTMYYKVTNNLHFLSLCY